MTKRTGELLFDKLRTAPGGPITESDSPPPVSPGGPLPASPPRVRETSVAVLKEPQGAAVGASRSEVPQKRIATSGDRLSFSLTSTQAGIAAFVAICVLAAAFAIGRNFGESRGRELGFKQGRDSYSSDTINEIEAARSQPPHQEMVASLLTGEPAAGDSKKTGEGAAPTGGNEPAASGEGPAVAWVDGYNYIVVQEFEAGALADAKNAREFLSENRVASAIVVGSQGRIRLIATEGFNLKEATQRDRAERLKKRIGEIGERFFAAGGRYKLQGYFAAYKPGAW